MKTRWPAWSVSIAIGIAVLPHAIDAGAAEWVDLKVTEANTGAKYFVDRASTHFDGPLMYVRVKRELKARYGSPEGERQFRPCIDAPVVCFNSGISIYNFAVHCQSRTTAETAVTKYTEQGHPISSHTVPRSEWEFTQAAPDTLADRLVSLACTKRKAPQKQKAPPKAVIS